MYKIMNPVWRKDSAGSPVSFVHPFYKTMFRKLYGLGEKEAERYMGKDGAVTYNCDFLAPLVKEVWEKHKKHVRQFYHIRTSEETGLVAPEYAILKRAGIRDISPVSICGMGSMALILGLQMSESVTDEEDCVILLLAETGRDPDIRRENTACAFALYYCKDINGQNGIWITDYQMYLNAGEMETAVKNFRGAIVCSEVEIENISAACDYILCKEHGLTTPLLYLSRILEDAKTADALSVHASGSGYGLIYYHISGKGRQLI